MLAAGESTVSDGFGSNARPARPPPELHRDVSVEQAKTRKDARHAAQGLAQRGPVGDEKVAAGTVHGGWRLRTMRSNASVTSER